MRKTLFDNFPGPLQVTAEWTDDCQGKKDYDASLVELSTRYWPRGGGFSVLHNTGGKTLWEENDARPSIKPSATATIQFPATDHADGSDMPVTIARLEVEGETEEEVRHLVESWAQGQYERLQRAVMREFGPLTTDKT